MKNSLKYYSVGPLLYCPADRKSITNSVIRQKLGSRFSLAFCLEDTINDSRVEEAEQILTDSVQKIASAAGHTSFYLPKIFIRVRHPEQIPRLAGGFGSSLKIIHGFIIPKFSLENADTYIQNMITVNERFSQTLSMMPVYESASLVDLRRRYDILYDLKEKLDAVEDLVLNIRVGGNDLCNLFSFRRHSFESIHRIRPVSNIFSDIITAYGMDYIVSGPVYEYYSGTGWEEGLIQEIADDRLCGFTGKTVIHPNQIAAVNRAYRVDRKDYEDALHILNWDTAHASYVAASTKRERMDELKTHTNWAKQILLMAEAFGIQAPEP